MNKKDLRKKVKDILSALSKEELKGKSLKVSQKLKSQIAKVFSNHSFEGHVGVYAPIQQEVHWYLEFKSDEYFYAAPHMLEDGIMEYHPIDLKFIECGKVGLELEDHIKSEVVMPDVLIIPGLGFAQNGDRLGRGKGYFDRFLSNFKGVKIGVCFDEQVFEKIPTDEHDVKLDYLITETNIFEID